jgi:hypothetical protein
MATWRQFSSEQPELAATVFERFEAHKHKTMATLRADGRPRISGTEAPILGEHLYLGGMTGNRRFADLRRDPRLAIHSNSDDPDTWTGDAKLSGTAVELVDPADHEVFREASGAAQSEVPPGAFELFRLEIDEAVVVRLSPARDHLVIETWREGAGLTTVQR